MGPTATLLPCGKRLHLQHGPIDLIIGADGDREAAFTAAQDRFATILDELVAELPELKLPLNSDVPKPLGHVARHMENAVRPFAADTFVTRMAAVAGSVADTILNTMQMVPVSRAYVNNGGDIALHLAEGQSFTLAMAGHDGAALGHIKIRHDDPIRGIATSGRHGRSYSLGVADSVTVLAADAAKADVAATLIANAVDCPQHNAITRKPASDLDDTSDLGHLPVVVGCGPLSEHDKTLALQNGLTQTQNYMYRDLIYGAALFLQGQSETTCPSRLILSQRTPSYA